MPLDARYFCAVISTIVCMFGVSLAAGMTLGYTSLDSMKLKIKVEIGTEDERRAAMNILNLMRHRHRFLCTLLVFNVICAECLPLLMDSIMPKWLSLLLSVTGVVLCGEVIPAGIFTGPNQLDIASSLVQFCQLLQYVFLPLAWPLAKMLDALVGEHDEDLMTREELACMMKLTRDLGLKMQDEDPKGRSLMLETNVLLPEEVNCIKGVLSMTEKRVEDLMIPMEKVYMVSSNQILDANTLKVIDNIGHSRIPVFKGENRNWIIGFLFVKKLIVVNPMDEVKLDGHPAVREVVYVDSENKAFDILDLFQTGKAHIAIVSNNSKKLLKQLKRNQNPTPDCAPRGILTLEDIIENMLQEQIYDEEDYSHRKKKRVNHNVAASLLHALTIRRSNSEERSPTSGLIHTVEGVENYGALYDEDLEAPGLSLAPIPLESIQSISSDKGSTKSEKLHSRKRWIKTSVGTRVHDDDIRLRRSQIKRESSDASSSSMSSKNSNNSVYNIEAAGIQQSGLFRSFTDGHEVDLAVDVDRSVDTDSTASDIGDDTPDDIDIEVHQKGDSSYSL